MSSLETNWKGRKIVVVGPAPPFRGGIAQFTDGLVTRLNDFHDVCLLSFKRQYPTFLFPGQNQRDSTSLTVPVPCHELIDSVNPVNWRSCGRWLAERRPDTVVVNYWIPFFGPTYGQMIRRMKRSHDCRVIFICHNITPHEPSRLDHFFNRYALRVGDAFVVMSEQVRGDLARIRPGAPMQQVPLPLNESFPTAPSCERARAELALPQTARVLLFFGLVRAYKGLDVLLQAMAVLRERLPVHLLIAGEFYQSQKPYTAMINNLGLSSLVQVHAGFAPVEQVGRFFAAADAAVLPYKSATQSGVSKMAYYFDRPVIVTDAGGLPNELEDGRTGVVARADDPASLAQAIERFFSLKREVSFVDNVRVFKQRYSWSYFVAALGRLDQSHDLFDGSDGLRVSRLQSGANPQDDRFERSAAG
jgi:glycosyltransferase involved in cell wall biosynthesis